MSLFLFLIGCAKMSSDSSNKASCANNGNVDFIYINSPCEECVLVVEEILDIKQLYL